MRLVNYGQGEIADRLTILALKILYGKYASKPVDHFEQERNVLLAQFRVNGRGLEHFLELGAVNGALWQAENNIREWRNESEGKIEDCEQALQEEIAGLAFRIQSLNDRRSELITLINVNTGNHQGEEKLT
jgi:hypothetical protein